MSMLNLLDERHVTNAIVRISGKKTDFVTLRLEQEYGQHHLFSIRLDYDAQGRSFFGNPSDHIKLIGTIVNINFQHGNDIGKAYAFRGVVTQVKLEASEGRHGYIVLEGSSPTIMFERGRRMDVYSEMTLRQIFEELTSGVNAEYKKTVNEPTFNNKLDFLMQCNETDWEFLQRISYLYGENLFYSGSEVLFGSYDEWKPVSLTYDKEITSLQFCTRMLANTFTNYHYQAEQDTMYEHQSPNEIENSNSYLDKTAESNNILTNAKPPKHPSEVPVGDPAELDELMNRRKIRTASQTVYVAGQAKSYEPSIGRLITVSMPESIGGATDLGTYRVIKSIHSIDQNHHYSNEFEAVPSSLKTMPVREPRIPQADSILATVRSNEDPKNQGRVQVDFPFANQYSEIWLRVMTPDAGSSESVEKNRGMVFIPEKGDQVMIGFELGDPNRPYVMGSMFHGNNGIGGQANNHIRSIITKSGHTIQFDDAKESMGITIKDINGNIIHLDTKGKNIEITAPQTIILKATDIKLEATNNIEMKAEAAIKADAMAELHLGAQSDMDIVTESGLQIKSMGGADITAKNAMQIEGQSTTLTSSSDTEVSGMNVMVKGQKTKLSGAAHKIEIT